jgi:16S rRNA (cytosine1402-N4)-methyltransferase
LEDRLIKKAFRQGERESRHARKLPLVSDHTPPLMKALTGRGLRPAEAEVKINPRSRSAVMRVWERS